MPMRHTAQGHPEDDAGVPLPPRRSPTADHAIRNAAETIAGAAANIECVAADLSRERAVYAGDRVRIEALYGPQGAVAKLNDKVDNNHRELNERIAELRGYAKWGTGAMAVGATLIGWAIATHRL